MPTILRKLPFQRRPSAAVAADEVVTIRPYQIIVWVSLAPKGQTTLPPDTPRLPAILDTGHSHNFSIQEQHLARWARFTPGALQVLTRTRVNRVLVPQLAADVWIHPNQAGQRDRFSGARPLRLELPGGITVFPAESPAGPRLPLLGLRALAWNRLHLILDGAADVITLRTARRFGWF